MSTKGMLLRQQRRATRRLGKNVYFDLLAEEKDALRRGYQQAPVSTRDFHQKAKVRLTEAKKQFNDVSHRLRFIPSFSSRFPKEAYEQMLKSRGIPLQENELKNVDEHVIRQYMKDRHSVRETTDSADDLRKTIHRNRVAQKRDNLVDREVDRLYWELRKKRTPVKEKYLRVKQWAKFHEYYRLIEQFQRNIPKTLLAPKSRGLAKRKLTELFNPQSTVAFRGENLEVSPVRYDSLARLMTELSKQHMFVGRETGLIRNDSIKRNLFVTPIRHTYRKPNTAYREPKGEASSALHSAEEFADWQQHGDYDCELFFSPNQFKHHDYGNPWGYLGEKPKLLAIRVTDPQPERVIELIKAMSKRRPNDPIPIFDLYGNIFYP